MLQAAWGMLQAALDGQPCGKAVAAGSRRRLVINKKEIEYETILCCLAVSDSALWQGSAAGSPVAWRKSDRPVNGNMFKKNINEIAYKLLSPLAGQCSRQHRRCCRQPRGIAAIG